MSRSRWQTFTLLCWTKWESTRTASRIAWEESTNCLRCDSGRRNRKEATMTHLRCFNGLWIAPVVLATSLFAASSTDVRLVEAVKNSDRAAIQKLLPQHVDLSAV